MDRLLKAELLKMKESRGFHVLLLLSVVFGAISSTGASSDLPDAGMSGYHFFFHQFLDLRLLMFVFAGVWSGVFIGEDFSSRSIQAAIACGHSRFSILLGKSISYMLGISILSTVHVLVATTIHTILHGFGTELNWLMIGNMARALFMFQFLVCACTMVYVTTSFMLKSTGTILAVNMLLLVVVDGVFQISAMRSHFLLTIYESTPLVQAILSSTEAWSFSGLTIATGIGGFTMLLFFVLTHTNFRRVELK